jgi:glycerol kinase
LGTTAAHVARAALEAVAYQTADLIDAMARDGAKRPDVLRIDGGMSANDWLCQFLADILDLTIERPAVLETTALGAAYLAGMTVGLWDGCDGVAALPRKIDRFVPRLDAEGREALMRGWRRALRQALMVA